VTLVADEKDDRMARDRGFLWADFQSIGIFPTRDVLIGFLEVCYYYEGFKGDHSYAFDRCIGLARMKRDRWASFSAIGRGMVEVFHGRVEGPEMTINARSANGTVRVEALENALAPKPILGFDRASCVPFTGDEIRHPVQWKDKTFAELQGREDVVLRFHLEAADLFAYEVHSSTSATESRTRGPGADRRRGWRGP